MTIDIKNPKLIPQLIVGILTEKYGMKWIEWETMALLDELEDDFGPLTEETKQKIRAVKVLTVSNSPWQDWDVFLYISAVCNNSYPTFGNPLPCTPSEAAWTVTVMEDIRKDQTFDSEVRGLLASILAADGYTVAPPRLAFIQGDLDLITRDMDNRDEFNSEVMTALIDHMRHNTMPEYNDNPVNIHVLKLLKTINYIESMYRYEE